MVKRLSPLLVLLAVFVAGACQPAGPLRTFTTGEQIAFYDFSRSDSFEQGVYEDASLLIRDGVYRIDVRQGDNELWWGQWGEALGDVVIDVEADLRSTRPEVAYGVMCRARGQVGQPVGAGNLDAGAASVGLTQIGTLEPDDLRAQETDAAEATGEAATAEATAGAEATAEGPDADLAAEDDTVGPDTGGAGDDPDALITDEPAPARAGETETAPEAEPSNGDGYLFLIQGGGSAGIFRARGRDLTPLADWRTSTAIEMAPQSNHLRAVCVGDYLALYVNDTLVAEATDDVFTSGQVGLAASAANRLGARVEFDDLTVAAGAAGTSS